MGDILGNKSGRDGELVKEEGDGSVAGVFCGHGRKRERDKGRTVCALTSQGKLKE